MLEAKHNQSTTVKLIAKHARSTVSADYCSHNFQALSGIWVYEPPWPMA